MKKALLIGINEYPCGNNLRFCANDARDVATLIESNGGGSPNFDVRLIEEKCGRTKLNNEIKQLFSGDDDIALLYFSGHGADKDGGYLCTSDCTDDNYGVRMNDVIEWANSSRCKNKIIILDCCFSAKMGESILNTNVSALGDGVTILAASRAWEVSHEKEEIGHGVFTELLIQALRGGAADIQGNITPAGVYAFIDQSLSAWHQRPVFKTNISKFLPIRQIEPKVAHSVLRKICKYFESPYDEYQLNPSYECTNSKDYMHELVEPYADCNNVSIFKDLQKLESVGIVEPVGTEHMYFAAMESKTCKLTALGLHYWKLAQDKRF